MNFFTTGWFPVTMIVCFPEASLRRSPAQSTTEGLVRLGHRLAALHLASLGGLVFLGVDQLVSQAVMVASCCQVEASLWS